MKRGDYNISNIVYNKHLNFSLPSVCVIAKLYYQTHYKQLLSIFQDVILTFHFINTETESTTVKLLPELVALTSSKKKK